MSPAAANGRLFYMQLILIFCGIIGITLLLLCWQQRSVSRLTRSRFAGRPALSSAEFGRKFFAGPRAELATAVHQVLARHLEADVARLHPDDRFIEDLHQLELDSLALVNLAEDVEKTFGIKIPDQAAVRIHTPRQLVDYIASAQEGNRST